jgi:hypothetical protein
MSLKHIKNPELFQGNLHKKHYFEGWYFKHVTADGKQTMAFIPGVSIDGADSHCFVQVILSPNMRTYYFRYPLEAFSTTDDPFSVTVGDSVFSMEGAHIALHDASQNPSTGISITGEMHYAGLTPIESSPWMPNIMGFFAYIPNMECNHGVLSMKHDLKGQIDLGLEETVDFTDGRGYIEKDWGISFPSAYIWIQANHFEDPQQSFMCSIATIPFGLFSFRGLIANLQVDGVEYRFATYNHARVKNYVVDKNRVSFDLTKRDVTLTCEAVLTESGTLKAPKKGEMIRTIKEGLSGEVTLTLKRQSRPPLVLKSACAGIEIVE